MINKVLLILLCSLGMIQSQESCFSWEIKADYTHPQVSNNSNTRELSIQRIEPMMGWGFGVKKSFGTINNVVAIGIGADIHKGNFIQNDLLAKNEYRDMGVNCSLQYERAFLQSNNQFARKSYPVLLLEVAVGWKSYDLFFDNNIGGENYVAMNLFQSFPKLEIGYGYRLYKKAQYKGTMILSAYCQPTNFQSKKVNNVFEIQEITSFGASLRYSISN